MTHTKDEALKLALEALELAQKGTLGWTVFIPDAITAIKQARSSPVQEPVAWMHVMDNTEGIKANGKGIVSITQKWKHPFGKPGVDFSKSYPVTSTPLYTTPPAQPAPVREPLSELEKDAANLLFALHDAWPYVHGNCTIESKRKAIQALIVKHGDFADLHPPAAQRQWTGLTHGEYIEAEKAIWDVVSMDDTEKKANREFYRAIEAKLKEKNT